MDLSLGDTRMIIDACKAGGVLRNQAAYVLATAFHETDHTMKPIYERGARSYFDKYEPGTDIGTGWETRNQATDIYFVGASHAHQFRRSG